MEKAFASQDERSELAQERQPAGRLRLIDETEWANSHLSCLRKRCKVESPSIDGFWRRGNLTLGLLRPCNRRKERNLDSSSGLRSGNSQYGSPYLIRISLRPLEMVSLVSRFARRHDRHVLASEPVLGLTEAAVHFRLECVPDVIRVSCEALGDDGIL